MLAKVQSFVLQGIDAVPCEIEIDFVETEKEDARSLIVGLPDAVVRESLERVRAALSNSGFMVPLGRLLISLAPADVRKEGPVYDLPVAIGLLMAHGVVIRGGVNARRRRSGSLVSATRASPEAGADGCGDAEQAEEMGRGGLVTVEDEDGIDLRRYVLGGELALDGRLRPIRGVIAMASLAKERGALGVIVPRENAKEAAVVGGVRVLGAGSLSEVVGLINGLVEPEPEPTPDLASMIESSRAPIDFSEVRGQEAVKRALTIAAAGTHNILLLGPPGTGKTMMAKALPGILPALAADEAVEITRIYSAAGQLSPGRGLVSSRPVRSPHHTASPAAVVGGGAVPRPGEISLAHHGVLFLDELGEFPRAVLETLRQPLEDHVVTIARSHSATRFPASFMLVAAMNPTLAGDVEKSEQGRRAMAKYMERISGPLLDRIDIHVEAPAVGWKELTRAPTGTGTTEMRERVEAARAKQRARQGKTPNAWLSGKELDTLAPLDDTGRALVGQAMTELKLSARAYDKIRRVARTIADIASSDKIAFEHVAEAVQYRLLDRRG